LNFFTIEKLRDILDYIDIRLEIEPEKMQFLIRGKCEISNGYESDMIKLRELECSSRKPVEGGGSYNFNIPYQSGHERLSSSVGHLNPYLILEGHYKAFMSSCETKTMDYYSKANPLFITTLKDYHAPNHKEAIGNGEEDILVVSNAHLIANERFPLF